MALLLKRTIHGLLLLAGVSLFTFGLLSAAPGNSIDELKLNPQISPETIAKLKSDYGLDRPLTVRCGRWSAAVARGEFGYSLSYHRSVGSLIWPRARNTLFLTTIATVLAWTIALPWGILEALYRGRWLDRIGGLLTGIAFAVPDTLFALMLLWLAAKTGWFPTGGMHASQLEGLSFAARLWDLLVHFFLPVVGLAFGTAPILIRHVRSAMAGVLDSPFIEAARGHGIGTWRLVVRHAFPAALNPLISLLGFSIGALLSMSLILEVVLSWPGLGPLVLEAILARDIHVVMAVVLLSSVFLVAGNLLADVLLYWSDPRVRTVQP